MFDHLRNEHAPDTGPSARTAVQARARHLARQRRLAFGSAAALILVFGGAGIAYAANSSGTVSHVQVATHRDGVEGEAVTRPTTTQTVPPAGSHTTDPAGGRPTITVESTTTVSSHGGTTTPPPTIATGTAVVNLSGHISCYGGAVAAYTLVLTGPSGSTPVVVLSDGTFSLNNLRPGNYTAVASCVSTSNTSTTGNLGVGGAANATKFTKTLVAGNQSWDMNV